MMCRQKPYRERYLWGTAMLVVAGLGLSIFASGDSLPAAQTIRNKGTDIKPNPHMEPSYELAPGARNPFLPSVILVGTAPEESSPESGKTPDVLVPVEVSGPPSPTDVATGVHLQAVFSKKGSIWGIFNGQPVKEGDAIECKIKGVICKLVVVKIELTPPRGVLRFGEVEFSCDLQSTTPKLLK